MGRELLTPTKKPQLSGFFYPLKIREGFEPMNTLAQTQLDLS